MKKPDSRIVTDLADAGNRLRAALERHGIDTSYLAITLGPREYAALEDTVLRQADECLVETSHKRTGIEITGIVFQPLF